MKAKFTVGDILYQPSCSTERLYLILEIKDDGDTVTRTRLLFPNDPGQERETNERWKLSHYENLGKCTLEKDEFLTEVYKTKGEMNG